MKGAKEKMRNKKISIKTVIIIVLILVIISLIFIILNMKNKNIEEQKIIKEKLEKATTDSSYIALSTHISELDEKQQEINNIQNTAGQATATAGQILKNYTAYKDGKLITGTMANNGALNATLNAGGSYTIPAGYHNGSGKVTANSLASQTSATATASDILSGKTAWVNGTRITGNFSGTNVKTATVKYVGYPASTSNAALTLNISNLNSVTIQFTLNGTSVGQQYALVSLDGTQVAKVTSSQTITVNTSNANLLQIHSGGDPNVVNISITAVITF